jgi:hypothetical protein
MDARLAWVLPLLCTLPLASATAERSARVGPLTAVHSNDVFLPWTCKGTVDLAAGTVMLPGLESDQSQKDGPWSPDRLKDGMPCSFAASGDRKATLALIKTGESSYYVLFFEGDRAIKSQRIHGPWTLSLAVGPTFPPKLEQRPEGDAGFLYEYDAKSGQYREKKRRNRPGDD